MKASKVTEKPAPPPPPSYTVEGLTEQEAVALRVLTARGPGRTEALDAQAKRNGIVKENRETFLGVLNRLHDALTLAISRPAAHVFTKYQEPGPQPPAVKPLSELIHYTTQGFENGTLRVNVETLRMWSRMASDLEDSQR